MSNICSFCQINSPKELSPLFIKDGNNWKATGLCEMLERCAGKKISEKSKSEVICIRCVKQIVEIYFEDDKNQQAAEIPMILSDDPSSSQPSCSNPAKKMKLDNESGVIHFDQPEKKDFINLLPVECLAKIFMYCEPEHRLKLNSVCEKWKTASSFAWTDTKKLNLSTPTEKKFSFIKDQSDLEDLLLNCGQDLTEFTLNESFFHDKKCDSNVLSSIGRHCPNLVKLELQIPTTELAGDDLLNLSSALNKLKSVNIELLKIKTTEPSTVSLLDNLSDGIENIIISVPFWFSNPCQLDKMFSSFEKFKHLRHLSLLGLQISRKLTTEISQKSSLVHLRLKLCKFEEKQLLTVNNLLHLEKLMLDYSSISDLGEIFQSLENNCSTTLKHLDLRHKALINAPNEILEFKNLEHLNIGSLVFTTDDFFKNLSDNSQKIKHLNIRMWNGLSAHALKNLSKFNHLEYLIASSLYELDDEVVYDIANNCKNLKHLNITSCAKVSGSAIKAIVKNCPKLKLLDIAGRDISVDTVVSIAKIVRHRKNNIVLTLRIESKLIKRFHKLNNASKLMSPWLKLRVDEYDSDDGNGCHEDSDEDTDEDDEAQSSDDFDSDDSTDLDDDYFDVGNDVDDDDFDSLSLTSEDGFFVMLL